MNVEKISVSIPKDVMEKLDEFMKASSYLDRSKIFQIAIKNFLDENSPDDVEVFGILNIVYDDEVTDNITKLQHERLSSIISTLHIHLNEKECMEAIAVKGKKSDLVKLTSSLSQIKGVKKAKLLTYEVEEK